MIIPALTALLPLSRRPHFLIIQNPRNISPAFRTLPLDYFPESGVLLGRPWCFCILGLVVTLPFILTLVCVSTRHELADFLPISETLGLSKNFTKSE